MKIFLMIGLSYCLLLMLLLDLKISFVGYLPWLLITFSFPHFIVTYWIWLKRVKSWKSEVWVLLFPFLFAGAFYLSFKGTIEFLSVQLLLKISYLYMLYHFAQQLFGVYSWINGYFGILMVPWKKNLTRFYFILGAFYSWIEFETRVGVNSLFYYPVTTWHIPSSWLSLCFYLFLLISLIELFIVLFEYLKFKALRRFLPLASLGLVWIWFIPPLNSEMLLWLPVLHGVQYMPFIFMKLSRYPNRIKILIGLFCILSGWMLFRYIPLYLFGDTKFVAPLFLSLLNNHHFLIDGRIWKLKDPENKDLSPVLD